MKSLQAPNIIDCPSSNFGDRRPPFDARGPRMIVLHYTDMTTAEAALERMCDPETEVSAHYLITRDGAIYRLVEEFHRAWHAGQGGWHVDGFLETDINSASIGIELDNQGHSNGLPAPFPPEQIEALEELCHDIMLRWGIPQKNIIGHSDLAPGRKADPGPLFPWRELAARGIGETVDDAADILLEGDTGVLQARLAEIGYDVPQTGIMDQQTRDALAAFRVHWGR